MIPKAAGEDADAQGDAHEAGHRRQRRTSRPATSTYAANFLDQLKKALGQCDRLRPRQPSLQPCQSWMASRQEWTGVAGEGEGGGRQASGAELAKTFIKVNCPIAGEINSTFLAKVAPM